MQVYGKRVGDQAPGVAQKSDRFQVFVAGPHDRDVHWTQRQALLWNRLAMVRYVVQKPKQNVVVAGVPDYRAADRPDGKFAEKSEPVICYSRTDRAKQCTVARCLTSRSCPKYDQQYRDEGYNTRQSEALGKQLVRQCERQ